MAYIDTTQIKGLYTRLKDGSIIEVEMDGQGHLIPLRNVKQAPQQLRPQPAGQPGDGDPLGMMPTPVQIQQQQNAQKIQQLQQEAIERRAQEEAKRQEAMKIKAKNATTETKKADQHQKSLRRDINQRTKYMTDRGDFQSLRLDLDDPAFRAMLQSVMTDNKFDRNVRGRTSGKIDMGRLYKVKTGATSVFAKKEARKGKNYNVVLVLDESGSMSDKIDQAAKSILNVAKAFDGMINLAIIGFQSDVFIHKYFDQKIVSYEELYKEMIARVGGGTNDFDALRQAYGMFKGMDGKNLVIMMSDGDGNDTETMHHLVKANEGVAQAVGIGLGYEARQIPDNVSAKNIQQLKPKLIDVLRRKIKRG